MNALHEGSTVMVENKIVKQKEEKTTDFNNKLRQLILKNLIELINYLSLAE